MDKFIYDHTDNYKRLNIIYSSYYVDHSSRKASHLATTEAGMVDGIVDGISHDVTLEEGTETTAEVGIDQMSDDETDLGTLLFETMATELITTT